MSEIPEHLLKRSKNAKSSKTGKAVEKSTKADIDDAAVEESGNKPVAQKQQVTPSPDLPYLDPEPEPPKKPSPAVIAAKNRKKIPYWAIPAVALSPLWAYGLSGTLQQPDVEDPLLTEAANLYSEAGCAGCHGANGGGGTGYQLSDGSVVETFPRPIDQIVHVARGSSAINGEKYGAVRSDGTQRVAGELGNMPAQADALTVEQIEMLVYHERAILSEEDQTQPGYEDWVDTMYEHIESEQETPVDMEFLLKCADPKITPEATGEGSEDPEKRPCPGPNYEKTAIEN